MNNKPAGANRALPLLLIMAGLLLSFRHPLLGLFLPAQLDITLNKPAIMPAMYKVYANENGLANTVFSKCW